MPCLCRLTSNSSEVRLRCTRCRELPAEDREAEQSSPGHPERRTGQRSGIGALHEASTQGHTERGCPCSQTPQPYFSFTIWDIFRHRHIRNSSECFCLSRDQAFFRSALKESKPLPETGATMRTCSRVLETFFLGVWFGSLHAETGSGWLSCLSPESGMELVTSWRCKKLSK